jgi:hypothetical protein
MEKEKRSLGAYGFGFGIEVFVVYNKMEIRKTVSILV